MPTIAIRDAASLVIPGRRVARLHKTTRYGLLLLLTLASFFANGYHYATDDGAIYLPDILQRLHPAMFHANAAFFHAHGSLSIFPILAGLPAEWLGGSVAWSVLLWQIFGLFLLLASAFRLAEHMFSSSRAAWSAVLVLAFVPCLFVAGTSIPIMDPYFTARTISTPLTLVAFVSAVTGKRMIALASLALAFTVHPLMSVFATMLIGAYYLSELTIRIPDRVPVYASALPLGLAWGRVQEPYRQTMQSRTFFFASRWTAIEWAGVFIPLAILFYLWRVPTRATTPLLRRVCGGAFFCGSLATIFFLIISLIPGFESFVRLQPMRGFQLIYIVLFLLVGGFLGEYVLRARTWRWSLVLLALAAMDVTIDKATYPESAHIEWPWAQTGNAWLQGFEWVRKNTPEDALFALPPEYMHAPGEDAHGFRAIAQRSALADQIKDSGVVSMFPELAPEWKRQMDAQAGWSAFTPADFHRLARDYEVSWVIVQLKQSSGLDCRYHNASIAVCHVG